METAMNWTWFHKLGSPKWFYGISGKLLPWLSLAPCC
jgi:heme exporter protein C